MIHCFSLPAESRLWVLTAGCGAITTYALRLTAGHVALPRASAIGALAAVEPCVQTGVLERHHGALPRVVMPGLFSPGLPLLCIHIHRSMLGDRYANGNFTVKAQPDLICVSLSAVCITGMSNLQSTGNLRVSRRSELLGRRLEHDL